MDPLADQLRRELRRFGPNIAIDEVVAAWPGAVGDEIARNAWPASFRRNGTLVVHARDAVWAFELTQRAAEISGRLPQRPKLAFVPGPLPEPEPPAAAPSQGAPPTPEQRAQASRWASEIEDPELRQAVESAAAASLAAASDNRSF